MDKDSILVIRASWHDRLIFNTWRRPFPYLLHRWDVRSESGWWGGFWRLSAALRWAHTLDRLRA